MFPELREDEVGEIISVIEGVRKCLQ